jgi:hypothetical protein
VRSVAAAKLVALNNVKSLLGVSMRRSTRDCGPSTSDETAMQSIA